MQRPSQHSKRSNSVLVSSNRESSFHNSVRLSRRSSLHSMSQRRSCSSFEGILYEEDNPLRRNSVASIRSSNNEQESMKHLVKAQKMLGIEKPDPSLNFIRTSQVFRIRREPAKTLFVPRSRNTSIISATQLPTPAVVSEYLIKRDGAFYKTWSFLMGIVVLQQTAVIPYRRAFTNDKYGFYDVIIDIMFFCDIYIRLNLTGVESEPPFDLIQDRSRIVRNYLKGWFLIDLLGAIPFTEIIPAPVLNYFHLFRLRRLLGLFKFLRLIQMLRVSPEVKRWLQYSRHSNLIRLVRISFIFLMIAHFLACIWHGLIVSEDWVLEHNEQPNIPIHAYWISGYVCLLLLTGNNINPLTEREKVFSSVVLMMGTFLMAVVFGNVAVLIGNFFALQTRYREKMENLYTTMRRMRLPLELQYRINTYYRIMWEKYGTLDGRPAEFVNDLSVNLRVEVLLHQRLSIFMGVKFFQKCSSEAAKELVSRLSHQVYMDGDYITVSGEICTSMFFIQAGSCEVTTGDPAVGVSKLLDSHMHGEEALGNFAEAELVVQTLNEGEFFGDIALLLDTRRGTNVRAKVFAEMCSLSRLDFDDVTGRYLEDRHIIEEIILNRSERRKLEREILAKEGAVQTEEEENQAIIENQERMIKLLEYLANEFDPTSASSSAPIKVEAPTATNAKPINPSSGREQKKKRKPFRLVDALSDRSHH